AAASWAARADAVAGSPPPVAAYVPVWAEAAADVGAYEAEAEGQAEAAGGAEEEAAATAAISSGAASPARIRAPVSASDSAAYVPTSATTCAASSSSAATDIDSCPSGPAACMPSAATVACGHRNAPRGGRRSTPNEEPNEEPEAADPGDPNAASGACAGARVVGPIAAAMSPSAVGNAVAI